jgi:hypothetical protein
MKPARPDRRAKELALNAIRNMRGQGWLDEALLVDHAATVIGGTAEAQRIAQAVWNEHFKITTPN